MSRSWWRGWRSWTSDAQLVTHTSACRRTHTSASPCHTSATRRAADVGFVIYPTGVVGSSEEVRRFVFSHEKTDSTILHYTITLLTDYTTTRQLSSGFSLLFIYIYILAPHSCLPSFKSYLISPTSSLWPFSTFFYLLLPVAPRCSLLSAIYSLITPSFLSRRFR